MKNRKPLILKQEEADRSLLREITLDALFETDDDDELSDENKVLLDRVWDKFQQQISTIPPQLAPTPMPSSIAGVVNALLSPITEQIATMIMQRFAAYAHMASTEKEITCHFWPLGVIRPETSQVFSLDGFIDWADMVMLVIDADTDQITTLHGKKTLNGWNFLLNEPLPNGNHNITVQGKRTAADHQSTDILSALVCVRSPEPPSQNHLKNVVDNVDALAGKHQYDDAVRIIKSNEGPERVISDLVGFIKNKASERYCTWMYSLD